MASVASTTSEVEARGRGGGAAGAGLSPERDGGRQGHQKGEKGGEEAREPEFWQDAQDRVADQGEEHRQRDWQQHRLRRPQGVADGERGQHHKRGGGARARRWGGGGGAVAGKGRFLGVQVGPPRTVSVDRKSTRLNSSH